MKRLSIQLCALLLFLTCTAYQCGCVDEGGDLGSPDPAFKLTDITLVHLDNAGSTPIVSTTAKIPKEAYMLEIALHVAPITPDEVVAEHAFPILVDGIKKIEVYTVEPLTPTITGGSNLTNLLQDYPLALPNQLYDTTPMGTTITTCYNTSIYKVLLLVPQAGLHRFRVVLSTLSGEQIERITTPIELY